MSGPHDFAVRISAARPASLPRPPHPAPTFVTTRTPLLSGRDARKDAGDLGVRSTMRIATDWHDGQFAHGCDVRFARRPRSAGSRRSRISNPAIWIRSCSYGLGGPAVPCFGLRLSNEPIFLFILPGLRLRRAGRSIECTVTVTPQASPLASRRLLQPRALRRPPGRTPPASCATAPA